MAAVVSWVLSSWAAARVVCVCVCVCVVCESDTLGQRLVVKAAGVDIDRQGAGSTDGVGGRKAGKLDEQARAGGPREDATLEGWQGGGRLLRPARLDSVSVSKGSGVGLTPARGTGWSERGRAGPSHHLEEGAG